MYCVTVFLFVPFVFRALIVLFWQQHNLNFKPNRRVRKCVWCAATARAYLPIYVQTWITQIYASNGLKLTTDLSTWQFNFTKQDRKRKKNPFFFFFLVVRSSIFFTDCHRHHSDIISSRNNSSVQAKCKQENKTAMHREKTLHKTPHHYVAVSTCILYLNVERATQLYLCPNKYTSIVDDIKKI